VMAAEEEADAPEREEDLAEEELEPLEDGDITGDEKPVAEKEERPEAKSSTEQPAAMQEEEEKNEEQEQQQKDEDDDDEEDAPFAEDVEGKAVEAEEDDDEAKVDATEANEENEDQANAEKLEVDRQHGPSLFEKVEQPAGQNGSKASPPPAAEAAPAQADAAPGVLSPLEPTDDPQQLLKKARVHWLTVRLSYRARKFLAKPREHLVRLIIIFRFFKNLSDLLPATMLVHVLEPMLSPLFRCSSFLNKYNSTLPEVSNLEEVLNLRTAQQLEFLGQLAQSGLDNIAAKMQESGLASEYTASLNKIRKAVEKTRALRVRERKLKPVIAPEEAALDKRMKNRRKQVHKKRKLQEMVINKKGGMGSLRSKKSKTLVV